MNFPRTFVAAVSAAATALLFVACGGNGGIQATATVKTLSNRADLISGGSALVEVSVPASVSIATLKVDVNGTNATPAFATKNGRTIGLITGLKNGANTLTATSTDNSFGGAQLVITNHPIGGPVLLATQSGPWVCATPIPVAANGNTPASNASGLSTAATDAQCNIATEYKLWYRTTTAVSTNNGVDGLCIFTLPDPTPSIAVPNPVTPANSCFQPYVTGTTPTASVALTTTANGVTLPYIVRVERGTLNRGIYDIAVLFDPTKPAWTAVAPQAQWNGKVLYTYGASTGQPRQQFRTEQNWAIGFLNDFRAADDIALRLGYMVADNSLTDSLYNSNRVLVTETTMMMKEHIVNSYGEIKYAMGNGCSGGSINQNTVATIYPGLLDGIQPTCDFPDSITTGIEVSDCVLLVNLYVKPEWIALQNGLSQTQIDAKKAAINGHRNAIGCHGWNNAFGFNNKPGNYVVQAVVNASGSIAPSGVSKNNCNLPAALVYDPITNPNGTRCGDADLSVAVWGATTGLPGGTSMRALTTNDNVGVQYGLSALLAGTITAEDFVVVNEKIGGTDVDSNLTAARSTADAAALPIAYRAGIVSNGKNLAKLAIIDSRGFDEGSTGSPIHYNWRSFEERARLDVDAGNHANQVIWRYGNSLYPTTPAHVAALTTFSFTTMDTWLSNLIAAAPKSSLNDPRTQAQIVAAKPAAAVDFCYLTADVTFTTKITDQAVCDADANLKVYMSPHQVAGGPRTENILKCQLKPLVFTDYTGVTFSGAQQTRLTAAFPTGVCDWSKPGVGQQDPVSPLTFSAGPGGLPLSAAPGSTAL